MPSLTPKIENFVNTTKKLLENFSHSVLFHMKTRVYLKHFIHGCLCKIIFASNSPQAPLNLICLTLLVTVMHLTECEPKMRGTKSQKSVKIGPT